MQIHFFWHMHQPSYIRNGIIDMPWVFLHAIKDYFDMPYLIEKTKIKPHLILQPHSLNNQNI